MQADHAVHVIAGNRVGAAMRLAVEGSRDVTPVGNEDYRRAHIRPAATQALKQFEKRAVLFHSFIRELWHGRPIVISRVEMVLFGRVPYIFIPLLIVLALFIFFTYFTAEGRRAKLLSGNQKVAVSIGIRENKNVLITYIVCGVILGFGALVYGSQQIINTQSNLSTSSILFSYIVPVFIGMFIGTASIDAVGVVVAAVGMELLNYGLDCLGVGAGGYQQIIFGMFMLAFYAFSAQSGNIKKFLQKIFSGHKKEGVSDAH